jgi:formate-dependent nitrite reductase membrane component NrfD
MPDTFVTHSAHWHWWGVLYFFVGGIAGGAFFLSAMIDLVGDREDRRLSRLGYLVALPMILLGALFLIVDLKQPLRFWHMVVLSERLPLPVPAFKWWSPISYGTWIISAFSLFASVAFLAALVKPGDTPRRGPLKFFHKIMYGLGPLSKLFLILGALSGLWLASYTGVLLTVTNRPIWADTNLLSLLFVFSGVSTAAALMALLALRRREVREDSLHSLVRMDDWTLLLELVALVALVASLWGVLTSGALGVAWLMSWGALLLLVAVAGILTPLLLTWRGREMTRGGLALAATLVLAGGFLLRYIVVFSSESL